MSLEGARCFRNRSGRGPAFLPRRRYTRARRCRQRRSAGESPAEPEPVRNSDRSSRGLRRIRAARRTGYSPSAHRTRRRRSPHQPSFTSAARPGILPRWSPAISSPVGSRSNAWPVAAGWRLSVYRARDLTSGAIVAVKILHDDGSPHAHERFERETAVLADLTHPAIVRHVAHGRTERGQLFLAMEWLEGATLSAILKRGGLAARDAVELVRRVAEGLGSAHARGFVHRDVKPSNILLVSDDVRRVKLVDFGVAHVTMAATDMTRTGVMLGTPGYMAPEQARGDRGIDARADVFSLGCVLFECLAGRPPFFADNLMAVLAKILIEDVPRLGELEPTVLPALDALVARMLAKDLSTRPADARRVALELAALGDVGAAVPSPRRGPSAPPAALTIGEQRVLTIVLAGAGDRPTTERGTAILPTLEPTGGSLADLRAGGVARHGGRLEKVLGGSLLVATFLARGAATDQVAQAARCALEIRKYLPSSGIAIATGRGQVASAWPVGEAIDRAAAMLRGDADLAPRPRAADPRRRHHGRPPRRSLRGRRRRARSRAHRRTREADASLRTLLGRRPIPVHRARARNQPNPAGLRRVHRRADRARRARHRAARRRQNRGSATRSSARRNTAKACASRSGSAAAIRSAPAPRSASSGKRSRARPASAPASRSRSGDASSALASPATFRPPTPRGSPSFSARSSARLSTRTRSPASAPISKQLARRGATTRVSDGRSDASRSSRRLRRRRVRGPAR